ncbi:hypothetical protein [Enterovirga rhinocerotis]|uniref:LTXXQ motif family protein n=1 Tax=Enterovirga rhinocerotis TaxID=1339210 RepID=A0A4R7C3M4_9HYPH|nr:hypothetical protein [Enterovirga rhinocerotis]TDR93044.1 hypothetical protein EV668_0292 [Enterovirga rhinocerotis]
MTLFRSIVTAAAAGCLFVAAPAAYAQSGGPAAGGGTTIEIYSDADAAAVLNARIGALKTVLELSPDQQKLWPPLEASIRKIAADSMARGKQRSEAAPTDFLDLLERVGDAEATRAADLKSFVAAARPLVATLTDVQKNRMPAFLGMAARAGVPFSARTLWLFEEEER